MKIYSKLTILNVLLECMQTKNPSKPELFTTTLSTVFCINNKLLHCRSNWLRHDEHLIIWLQLTIFLNRLGEIFLIFKQYKFQERIKISRERKYMISKLVYPELSMLHRQLMSQFLTEMKFHEFQNDQIKRFFIPVKKRY